MKLTEILNQAAVTALRANNKVWSLDVPELVRRFKEIWLYDNVGLKDPDLAKMQGPLFFLLHKNLGVTNASALELVTLLRIHCSHVNGGVSRDFQFFSDAQFTTFFEALWLPSAASTFSTQLQLAAFVKSEIQRFVARYSNVLETTIVMDLYYTSALVHIPRTLTIDLRRIVCESGYIHSAGAALYVRNIAKVEGDKLNRKIREYVDACNNYTFVTPYADEFFRPHEAKYPVSVRNGLDGVRLQIRKHYVDALPMLDYFSKLATDYPTQLHFPQGLADFRKEREQSIELGCAKDRTLWFITDRSIDKRRNKEAIDYTDDAYLFVYVQYIHSNNQLTALKERKPAWYASVTLPHTLSAAAINIARGNISNSKHPLVLDPFCGTATTLIDAGLRIKDAVLIGLDREPIVEQVVPDNLEFLSRTASEILWYEAVELKPTADLVSSLCTSSQSLRNEWNGEVNWYSRLSTAIALIQSELERRGGKQNQSLAVREINSDGFSNELRQAFQEQAKSLNDRLMFYICWRAVSLGGLSLRGDPKDIFLLILAELNRVREELKYLATCIPGDAKAKFGAFCEEAGLYSLAGAVSPTAFSFLRSGMRVAKPEDLSQNLEPGLHISRVDDSVEFMASAPIRADLIVTDPPYGFNTSEGGADRLKDLFAKLATSCLQCLKPGGQLILVLPAFARNGRQIPFYETDGFLVRSLIGAAARDGRRFANPVFTLPGDKSNFDWPLYWRSGTVLERRIVSFTVTN